MRKPGTSRWIALVCGVLLDLSSALAGSYTVQPGDTAYSIAARFGISLQALLTRNKLSGPSLRVGQVLDVPDNLRHTVARGETLFSIARRYNADLNAIRQANKLGSDALRIGQVLLIPISTTSNTTTSDKTGSSNTKSPTVTPSSPPTPTSTTPITVKPSPPPLPNPVTNTGPGNTTPKPSNTSSSASITPSTVSAANLPITARPNTPLTPPDALPRSTVTIPMPDPGNPFGVAKGQPIGPVPFSTTRTAPLPDLGAPPANPEIPDASPDASTAPNGTPIAPTTTAPASSSTTTTTLTPAEPSNTTVGIVSEDPEILHSVSAGDTLFSIARRYGVTVNAIKLANNLSSDALSVGQILNIPVLTRTTPVTTPINPTVPPSATTAVRDVAERYLGVTYRYGGTSPEGLDCSGFVVIVFSELGIKLPRTSAQQFQYGQAVERQNLRLGDLVFFNTSGQGVSHVGIYLESGEFIHAASNPGKVMKSRLDERYYAQRYLGARRVMTDD
jgi:cell wall-associated NlpC family hydrolase